MNMCLFFPVLPRLTIVSRLDMHYSHLCTADNDVATAGYKLTLGLSVLKSNFPSEKQFDYINSPGEFIPLVSKSNNVRWTSKKVSLTPTNGSKQQQKTQVFIYIYIYFFACSRSINFLQSYAFRV